VTPAETLTAAADKLDALLTEVTPGPWIFHGNPDPESLRCYICGPEDDDTGGHPVLLEGVEEAWVDAQYLAAMHPAVGRAVVTMLRSYAYDATVKPEWFVRDSLLDLARAILGGES
jgi:hypothetical protein